MARSPPSVTGDRREQMFPTLEPSEMERLRRFGVPRSFAAGEAVAKVGEPGHGLTLVISGQIAITSRDELGHSQAVVTHGPGSFMGELAQLSGRPSLIDAYAVGPVEAVIIAPDRLRALLVAEAELGERIMRALILRRVRLLETAGIGPIIVGRPGQADVLRLQSFLNRNGHPNQTLDPETDPEARAKLCSYWTTPPFAPP
jgi:thioredoxin reductase (NADPH)